jgi:hypothetical protein
MGAISIRSQGGDTQGIGVHFGKFNLNVSDTSDTWSSLPTDKYVGDPENQSITTINVSRSNPNYSVVLETLPLLVETDSAPFETPNTHTFGLGYYTINSTGGDQLVSPTDTLSVANCGITLSSSWAQPLGIAVNGLQLKAPAWYIWTTYNNLQNTQSNIGVDFQGLVTTQEINTSDAIDITFAFTTTVYMIRQTNWNTVDITGWTSIGNAGNIIQDISSDEAVYERTFTAGTYTFDNNSAMYMFNPDRSKTVPTAGLMVEEYEESTTFNHNLNIKLGDIISTNVINISKEILPNTLPTERLTLKTIDEQGHLFYFDQISITSRKDLISNLPDDGFFNTEKRISVGSFSNLTPYDLNELNKLQSGTRSHTSARIIDSTGAAGEGGGGGGTVTEIQTWY